MSVKNVTLIVTTDDGHVTVMSHDKPRDFTTKVEYDDPDDCWFTAGVLRGRSPREFRMSFHADGRVPFITYHVAEPDEPEIYDDLTTRTGTSP